MSWICVYCETANSDNVTECEVCGKHKDVLLEPLIENHMCCKGIQICGTKENLTKKFKEIGFQSTTVHGADLIGKFAGFDYVHLYFNFNSQFNCVTSIKLRIYDNELPNPLEIYEELKDSLSKKYPKRQVNDFGDINRLEELGSAIRQGNAKRETIFHDVKGTISLSVNCSGKHRQHTKIEIEYADDLNYYIQKEMLDKERKRLAELQQQKMAKERRMKAYEEDL